MHAALISPRRSRCAVAADFSICYDAAYVGPYLVCAAVRIRFDGERVRGRRRARTPRSASARARATARALHVDHDAACLITNIVGLFCHPDAECGFCPAAPGYRVECGEPWQGVKCHIDCDDDGDCPADLYCDDPDLSLCCPGSTPSESCGGYCNSPADCSPGETCVKVSKRLCHGRQL
jgi:hypothetical protein